MALLDKLNTLAATATSKANNAIENGKLNLKINSEERKIAEFTLNIGELLVDKLDAGETFDDEIMALYASIQAAREVILRAQADLEANRQAEEASPAAPACASCGAPLTEDAKFCTSCGAKVEEPSPEVVEAEVVPPTCASCGAPLEDEANFCTQCGTKVEPEPTPEAPTEEPAE